jgi:hypothetical protein
MLPACALWRPSKETPKERILNAVRADLHSEAKGASKPVYLWLRYPHLRRLRVKSPRLPDAIGRCSKWTLAERVAESARFINILTKDDAI